MNPELQSITWDAPEHYHVEKKSDWFWALGILAFTSAFASIFLGNFLFGILIIVAAGSMALLANREPAIIPFAVTTRGVRVNELLYPYSTLESYHIDTENSQEPILIVKSKQMFMSLIIIPIPEEYIDDVESIIEQRLVNEDLEEPFAHKIMEFFGF